MHNRAAIYNVEQLYMKPHSSVHNGATIYITTWLYVYITTRLYVHPHGSIYIHVKETELK